MNWRDGLFRLWVLVSVIWAVIVLLWQVPHLFWAVQFEDVFGNSWLPWWMSLTSYIGPADAYRAFPHATDLSRYDPSKALIAARFGDMLIAMAAVPGLLLLAGLGVRWVVSGFRADTGARNSRLLDDTVALNDTVAVGANARITWFDPNDSEPGRPILRAGSVAISLVLFAAVICLGIAPRHGIPMLGAMAVTAILALAVAMYIPVALIMCMMFGLPTFSITHGLMPWTKRNWRTIVGITLFIGAVFGAINSVLRL